MPKDGRRPETWICRRSSAARCNRCSSAFSSSGLASRSAALPATRLTRRAISGRASRTPSFPFPARARQTGRTLDSGRRADRRRHRRRRAVYLRRILASAGGVDAWHVTSEHSTRARPAHGSWCSMPPAQKWRGARSSTRRSCRSPDGWNTIRSKSPRARTR